MRLIIRRWVSLLSFVMNRKKEKWRVAKCSKTNVNVNVNVNVNPWKRTLIFNISCKNLIWLEKRTLCKTGSILMTFHIIAMHCVEVLFLAPINSSSLKHLGGGQSQTDSPTWLLSLYVLREIPKQSTRQTALLDLTGLLLFSSLMWLLLNSNGLMMCS